MMALTRNDPRGRVAHLVNERVPQPVGRVDDLRGQLDGRPPLLLSRAPDGRAAEAKAGRLQETRAPLQLHVRVEHGVEDLLVVQPVQLGAQVGPVGGKVADVRNGERVTSGTIFVAVVSEFR